MAQNSIGLMISLTTSGVVDGLIRAKNLTDGVWPSSALACRRFGIVYWPT